MTFTTREGFTVALPTRDQVRPLVMVLAAVASFLLASFVSTQWMTLLSWWHQVPFGASDPVLGHDAALLRLHACRRWSCCAASCSA